MRGTQAEQGGSRVTVLALDRWGRVLVTADATGDAPPSTRLRAGESPDLAALRVFEEATGAVLDELHLFPGEGRGHHVYYCDPDLALEELAPHPHTALRYLAPAGIESARLSAEARALLTRFVASSAYRAMFH